MSNKRRMTLYHATTPKKMARYRVSGNRILAPVRGFTTLQAASAWALKTGRTIVLEVLGEDCHKLPDHHNEWGQAWWSDEDVTEFKVVISGRNA